MKKSEPLFPKSEPLFSKSEPLFSKSEPLFSQNNLHCQTIRSPAILPPPSTRHPPPGPPGATKNSLTRVSRARA